jgi:hypothetical protein
MPPKKRNQAVQKKDESSLADFYSYREIAVDKDAPQHIREYAVNNIIAMKENMLSFPLKHRFLTNLLKSNVSDEKFKVFVKKKINQITQKEGKKKGKVVSRAVVQTLTIQKEKSDREFLNETVALIRKGIKKSGPWGVEIDSSDAKRLIKLGVLDKLGIYLHRRRFTDHQPVPFNYTENPRERLIVSKDVNAWKKEIKPLLMSFSKATEEILEARTRFKVMENRLNIADRFMLKDLFYNVKTNRGNLVIRTDFVGLRKTELGLKGQWVLSILGLHQRFHSSMNSLGWKSLDSFCSETSIPKEGFSQDFLKSILVMKCATDEGAQKELAIFLEEVLVEFFNAKIQKFEMFETFFQPGELKVRQKQIGMLKRRTEWIIRNPRGPYVNNCLVCGKPLSVSISVQREIGPHCWEKLSHEKELKMVDLHPDYVPLDYEARISLNELMNLLKSTFNKLAKVIEN